MTRISITDWTDISNYKHFFTVQYRSQKIFQFPTNNKHINLVFCALKKCTLQIFSSQLPRWLLRCVGLDIKTTIISRSKRSENCFNFFYSLISFFSEEMNANAQRHFSMRCTQMKKKRQKKRGEAQVKFPLIYCSLIFIYWINKKNSLSLYLENAMQCFEGIFSGN